MGVNFVLVLLLIDWLGFLCVFIVFVFFLVGKAQNLECKNILCFLIGTLKSRGPCNGIKGQSSSLAIIFFPTAAFENLQ